jgi:hypothetical protein
MSNDSLMKWTGRLAALFLGLAILAGCARPLADRVEGFVERTEARYEKYSDEDWQESLGEYQALMKEYRDIYQALPKEERDRINKAFGKYTGVLLKKGISTAGNALQEAVEGASSFLEGLLDSVGGEE